MDFLISQIFICLLIAGLIGAVIGWFLRGGCSKKLHNCEDKYKARIAELESDYSINVDKDESSDIQAATLKRHAEHVETQTPTYSYEEELKEKLNEAQHMKSTESGLNATLTGLGAAGVATLATKGINISDKKANLYAEYGVDFENTNNLEDEYKMESIEGVEDEHIKKLKKMEIYTTKDLITKLKKNHEAFNKTSKKLKIEPSVLSSWISMADLIQLPGVSRDTAKLLQSVGIASTTELGITNANSLHNQMVDFNNKASIVKEVPTVHTLDQWSKIAKQLN